MNTIGVRLRYIRGKILKLSRQKFVDGLDISTDTIQNYENDTTSPDANFLNRLWMKYHKQITLDDFNWLLTGEKRQEKPSDDYAHIPLYDVRAAAGGGAFVEAERITDVLAFRKEWIANELRVSVKDLAVIFVEGDSMTPTLNPGDIMLVVKDGGLTLQDGVYVILLDDTLLVKRLQKLLGGRLAIQSDNPNYRPIEVDMRKEHADFRVIGRVVWAGRRF